MFKDWFSELDLYFFRSLFDCYLIKIYKCEFFYDSFGFLLKKEVGLFVVFWWGLECVGLEGWFMF